MKPRKKILILLLGLLLVAFSVGIGQTPAQGDQKEKAEACCAMESCCCNSGSCPMKENGATKAEGKECCCCSGDSCEMKANDAAKKGACCNMKHKHTKMKAKQKTA
jgi:hypothetical protein